MSGQPTQADIVAVLATAGIREIAPESDEASDPDNPWGRGFDHGWNHALRRVLEALRPLLTDTADARAADTATDTGLEEYRRCPRRWTGSADHTHKCRHPAAHPGRHVCSCRSWVERSWVEQP